MEDLPKPVNQQYFLQVLKDGDDPKWPETDEELLEGNQTLGSGYTQYWAYLKSSGKEPEDLPPAEILANENETPAPAILIDQKGDDLLQLVLVKDSHAWIHAYSNLDNLEDTIAQIVGDAKEKYGFKVEHFLTTNRVIPEVEHRLDKLEQNGNKEGGADESRSEVDQPMAEEVRKSVADSISDSPEEDDEPHIKHLATIKEEGLWSSRQAPPQYSERKPNSNKSVKLAVIIPILVIGLLFIGVLGFKARDKVLAKLSFIPFPKAEVTPTPVPTLIPTPTPVPFDRSKFKVRVLNGTTKTGAAGTLADDLKSKGWDVLSKGNAKNQSTSQTQVSIRKDLEQTVLDQIMDDLESSFEATKAADLNSTDKADVEVVIGRK